MANDEMRTALRELSLALIAVKPHLDKPYPERPEWSPWTRFIERPFKLAGAALAHKDELGRE